MATDVGPSMAEPFGAHDTAIPAPDDAHHVDSPDTSLLADEADTCRICRGEGSASEPLFYPCKCNGSIRYVHQECLMEWLSHTQKKHCELCKTPFRFTKLYHPRMPNRIPLTVFVRRAALHVVNMFVTWCRAVLVASVWLLLLPWCVRFFWRSLFWVGDGGWPRDLWDIGDGTGNSTPSHLDPVNSRPTIEAATPANSMNSMSLWMPLFSVASTSHNVSAESPTWTFAKRLLFGFPRPLSLSTSETNLTITNATSSRVQVRNPSLLSDVPFFNWFSSETANGFIIDVLEGQIITIWVVVAFILIFLIREWVVQQQPVINMVALGNHAAAPGAADQNDGAQPREGVEEADDDEEEEEEEEDEEEEDEDEEEEDDDEEEPQPALHDGGANIADAPPVDTINEEAIITSAQQSPTLPPSKTLCEDNSRLSENDATPDDVRKALESGSREDLAKLSLANLETIQDAIKSSGTEPHISQSNRIVLPAGSGSLPLAAPAAVDMPDADSSEIAQRPVMPLRGRSFIASEIRRSLEEANDWSFEDVPHVSQQASSSHDTVPDSWEDEETDTRTGPKQERLSDQEQDSEHSSESWQQIADVIVGSDSDQVLEGESLQGKGKAMAVEEETEAVPTEDRLDGLHTRNEQVIRVETEVGVSSRQAERSSGLSLEDPGPEETELDNTGGDPTTPDESPAVGVEPRIPLQPQPNVLNIIIDWVFGDVAPAAQAAEEPENDEHIVHDIADEAPFVPFAGNEPQEPIDPPVQDPEVAAAAAQAGIDVNDQDAIEDAEDLEGILELIGMQGHIVGLFQNVVFSALLIMATLACAVWLPYLWGKVVILIMGSPIALLVKLPLQFVANLTDLLVDLALVVLAGATYWGARFVSVVTSMCAGTDAVSGRITTISASTKSLVEGAIDRIGAIVLESPLSPRPGHFRLSVNSHAALRSLQNTTAIALNETSSLANTVIKQVSDSPLTVLRSLVDQCPHVVVNGTTTLLNRCATLLTLLWSSKSYKITFDLDLGHNTTTAYTMMVHWTASDRMIAVFAGYAFFALAGAAYLKRGTPITSSQQGRNIERIVTEVLQQAGGVLKVILIISIEMLAFPLYCGLLLDLAMLPLFKDATLYTRWQFTCASPWTSGFVHWFIGTCYMFHFALFVSMCRKMMRKGVLYFIRDPDDPTFHPVRDVLERSVTTQLRKIAFSALVYGALVIVCLGGVVWTLSRATSNVLPIHWTTEAPSLEFPLDLLFYNFLAPVIIKFYKPSESLHTVYKWWFKTCAGFLRLSNFLFGDKIEDHEGQAGRYVRAPASDQARIPKGQAVFIEVDKNNVRKDGQAEGGVHNSDLVGMVFVPRWFRLRIFAFVVTIWLFMGMSGVSVTIIPLLFGRCLFSLVLPETVEMNDIHAFSLGVYTLGSIIYSGYHAYHSISSLNHPVPDPMSTLHTIASTISRVGLRVLRFTYVWASLVFIIPSLFAILIELYLLMPLHAYLNPADPHVVHIIQDWSLGFLYSRLAAHIVFANRQSRPAIAFNAVIRDGYLYPNARIATRCFLIPVLVLWLIAIAIPASLAVLTTRSMYASASEQTRNMVWRFSFPAVGMSLIAMWASQQVMGVLSKWRLVVKDEVYLIGERLHNFGETKAPVQSRATEEKIRSRAEDGAEDVPA
jgi:E3 ubiquitin-protein ligase MARCH6